MGNRTGSWTALTVANIVFVVSMLLHGIDHSVQDRGVGALSTEVFVGGTVLAVMALGALALTLRRDRRAPLVAAFVGLWTAVAVTSAHLLPHWSAFSDPYQDLSLGPYSWGVVIAEILTGAIFGIVGLMTLREQRSGQPSSSPAQPAAG
jgi:hypothetical protein